MKNNRKVAAFALVLVAAFLIAGIGYAYTSTTSTTGNTVTSENILITPGVGTGDDFVEAYTGTAKDIKYDTEYKADENDNDELKWFYGIEFNPVDAATLEADNGQSLTNVSTLRVTNVGDAAKTIDQIVVKITNPAFVDQFKTGGIYASAVLVMKLVDPTNSSMSDSVEGVVTDAAVTFTITLQNCTKILPVADDQNPDAYLDYGFSFVIKGDIVDAADPVCTHTAVLDPTPFAMKFRAIAADVA